MSAETVTRQPVTKLRICSWRANQKNHICKVFGVLCFGVEGLRPSGV